MARNRVLYILAVLICFGFSMAYVGKVSEILLLVVLLYPVLAAVMTAIQLFFVNAYFSFDSAKVPKNMTFDLMLRVSNRFIFPVVPMELLCTLPDGDIGLFADKRLFISLPPFGKSEIPVRCKHRFRGSYRCEIRRLYVVDPLRIIRVSKKCERAMMIMFLPRKLALEDIIFRSAVEQSYTQKTLNSADKDDFSHVREYRDGDVLQLVHWKLTAKQDELMIKQFDSINDLRAVVLCDYSQADDLEGMKRADMVIETAIAFVKTALDKGIHSTVDMGDINAKPSFVNDIGTFNRFYDLMSVLSPDIECENFCTMIDELDKSRAAILVLITTELSDELIERARNSAQQVTVFYVYLNIESHNLDVDYSHERFLFLNVMGTEENALENAAAEIIENEHGVF